MPGPVSGRRRTGGVGRSKHRHPRSGSDGHVPPRRPRLLLFRSRKRDLRTPSCLFGTGAGVCGSNDFTRSARVRGGPAMNRSRRLVVGFIYVAGLALTLAGVAAACMPEFIFRAYLIKTSWRPARRDLGELLAGLPPEERHVPYAGMAHQGASPSLQTARDAY